jgi:hypothetical protein
MAPDIQRCEDPRLDCPGTRQVPARKDRGPWARKNALLLIQVAIVAAALLFDVLGDRSLGALMLSTLPIALISGACCLIGPWMSGERRRMAFRTWLAGAVLVTRIVITWTFCVMAGGLNWPLANLPRVRKP